MMSKKKILNSVLRYVLPLYLFTFPGVGKVGYGRLKQVAGDEKTYKLSSLFLPPSSRKYPFTFTFGQLSKEMQEAEKILIYSSLIQQAHKLSSFNVHLSPHNNPSFLIRSSFIQLNIQFFVTHRSAFIVLHSSPPYYG